MDHIFTHLCMSQCSSLEEVYQGQTYPQPEIYGLQLHLLPLHVPQSQRRSISMGLGSLTLPLLVSDVPGSFLTVAGGGLVVLVAEAGEGFFVIPTVLEDNT